VSTQAGDPDILADFALCGRTYESTVGHVLTGMGPPYNPAMGTYQLRALLCRIAEAGRRRRDSGRVLIRSD